MVKRLDMEAALKAQCVAQLRELGFKGSFPNLYREQDGFISLVNFQFFSSGGSFCVNLSYTDKNRSNIYFKKETEAKNLKVSQARERARLGASNLIGDKWFCFAATDYGEVRGTMQPPAEIAAQIKRLLREEAEPWWDGKAQASALPTAPQPEVA